MSGPLPMSFLTFLSTTYEVMHIGHGKPYCRSSQSSRARHPSAGTLISSLASCTALPCARKLWRWEAV